MQRGKTPFQMLIVSLALLLCNMPRTARAEDRTSPRSVILLVHGIVPGDVNQPSQVWGKLQPNSDGEKRWTGMIGFLERQDYRFGGVFWRKESDVKLDTTGTRGDPKTADCFSLSFSSGAAADGLAYKCMELASALAVLREYTGCKKVRIVAHSAGGLVARAYVQSALPDLKYRGDVDRLITIATPHLGSAVAEHFGDFLGTRATSLKSGAQLVQRLNQTLDLPTDINYASIVVRSIWQDVGGAGSDYDQLVDQEYLRSLPVDFREGGDEILNVRTQNLRLAACARRYENTTRRAVQYVVARVLRINNEWAHSAATQDADVQAWVHLFLSNSGSCWKGDWPLSEQKLWIDRQVVAHALAVMEVEALKLRYAPGSNGVTGGRWRVQYSKHENNVWNYRFVGDANWRGAILGINSGKTRVAGSIELTTDVYGRVIGVSNAIDDRRDLAPDDTSELPLTAAVDNVDNKEAEPSINRDALRAYQKIAGARLSDESLNRLTGDQKQKLIAYLLQDPKRKELGFSEASVKDYPDLVLLTLTSESMPDKEKRTWADLFKIVDAKRRADYRSILVSERKMLDEIDDKISDNTPTRTDPTEAELIKLIQGSPLDDKERQEWFDRLPKMSPAQRADLKIILINEPPFKADLTDAELIKLIHGSPSLDEKERKEWLALLPKMNSAQRADLKKILAKETQQEADVKRGIDLIEKGEYKTAITLFSRLIDQDPKNSKALYLRGLAYQSSDDHTLAIEDFYRVTALAPESIDAYRRRARSHRSQRNYTGAFIDYSRAAEIAPKDPVSCNELAWFLGTCTDDTFRNGKEAIKWATKACAQTQWKKPVYLDTLAAAYAANGQFEKAVEWQAKALEDADKLEGAVGKKEVENARHRLALFKKNKSFRDR